MSIATGIFLAGVIFTVIGLVLHKVTSYDSDVPFFFGIFAALFLVVGGFGSLLQTTSEGSCRKEAKELKTEYRFGLNDGCRLKLNDGRYIDSDNYYYVTKTGK